MFDMKCLNENKNNDVLVWKIKGDIGNITIPGTYFERGAEIKKEPNLHDNLKKNSRNIFSRTLYLHWMACGKDWWVIWL